MRTVFILHHSYELGGCNETKLIGAYSTKEQAELAITRLKDKNGFKYRPEAFEISEYELDQDNWTEGFSTITTIQVKSKDNAWMTVQAECLPNNQYQIWELYDNDLLDEFKHLDIVECEERDDDLFAFKLVSKSDTSPRNDR
ncbi:DUF7336 domain-containing protein [Pedobacter punctiformis]|uniref:DUF7336 domain-containing protein n=1 Tax=Pedobacter punctiformis TaxID=3004097 RepID=A0ABT4LCC9_9SPHI|nr:hypothetical protein [Pedobacter sp. HCMS5-2]MCZ4244803.1 hypothetical protein [Pedobacter sp. HCMS5-2]